MKRTGKFLECTWCKGLKYFPDWHIKRGNDNGFFCSRDCYWLSMKGKIKTAIIKNCDICGKELTISKYAFSKGRGKACSKDCAIISISRTLTGRPNPQHAEFMKGKKYRYVSDRSKLSKRFPRRCTRYSEWRKSVCERDGWKCRMNNVDCSGILEIHHILNYKEYPELRHDVNNGITLCHSHHPRGREKEKRLAPFLQGLVSVSKVHI